MNWDYYEEPRLDIQSLISARGSRILDVGCGAGALAAALKASGAEYVAGIEAHPEAAARARARVDRLVAGSVLEVPLPFEAGKFDYLIFGDVLEHLADPDAALRRCLPFLAPEGRVVISVPNTRFYTVLIRLIADRWAYSDHGIRDRTHLRIFTRRSLLAMVEAAGLEVERLTRNHRLFEDQSSIGRTAELATRLARATVARLLFRDLMAFQYVVLARRRPAEQTR